MSDDIFCPNCEPVYLKKYPNRRCGVSRLQKVEDNYSGCGVDIFQCDKCSEYFQVSYKVDEIIQIQR